MCEICQNWERTDVRIIHGKPIAPNHHPNCPHYNDSLIPIWKVSDGTTSFYSDDEDAARTEAENIEDVTITRGQIHREVYENLPDFDGF